MTWQDLKQIETLTTRALSADINDNEGRTLFVINCLVRFLDGDQGNTSPEDQAANLAELAEGCGRIVTSWNRPKDGPGADLADDLFIIAYFDESNHADINYNYILTMYKSDY